MTMSSPFVRGSFAAATFFCLLILGLGSAHAQRLPDTVRPDHYTLSLTPDLKTATFAGVESIDVTLKVPTTSITLNSAEIAFQSVAITASGKQQTATVSSDKDKEQTTFTVPDEFPAGKATLAIHYRSEEHTSELQLLRH